jgi:parallel beta-helix repeat protein
MNSSNNASVVSINGGSANIQNSVIENYTGGFNFTVSSGSTFTLQGSTITGLNPGYSFVVNASNSQIISNTIQADVPLLVLNANNLIIQGNNLEGSSLGVLLVNSSYDTFSGNTVTQSDSNGVGLLVNVGNLTDPTGGISVLGSSAGSVYSQNTFNNIPGTAAEIAVTNGDVVKNNIFENSQNGLEIAFNSNMNVVSNQFNSISQVGLQILYESDSNNLITSNTFSNNGQGVLVDSSTGVVTIQSNTFTNTTGIGFSSSTNDVFQSNTFNLYAGQTAFLYGSDVNNTIINSNTVNNGDYGINGPAGGGSNILNLTITNNVFSGQNYNGIYLSGVDGFTITGNTIISSGGNGIYVFGSTNTNISSNKIQNNTNLDVEVNYNPGCSSVPNNTLIQSNNFSFGGFHVNDTNIGVCADCNSSSLGTITIITGNNPNDNSTLVNEGTCPPPLRWGCPYIQTFNNGVWSYQRGAILGLVTPYMAVWRAEKLYNAGDSNSLSLMVHEIPSETGHYNGFKLLVVDHPTGEAFFNEEQDSTPLIVNNPLNVVNCVDSYGRNCLKQVSSSEYSFLQGKAALKGFTILNQPGAEKNAWFSPVNFSNPSQLEDWIQVTLPNGWRNASEIKLLVSGTATGLNSLTEDYWGENNFNHNIVGFIIQNTPLNEIIKKGAYYFSSFKIEAQQSDGSWKTVIGENNCALDDYKTCAILIPTGDVQTGNVRIVEPAFIDAIDSVKVDYTPSFAFVSTLLPSSIDFNNSSFSENTSGFLTSDLIVPQNDFVIINFTGIPSVKPGFTRSLFLDFNGWYDPSSKDLSLIQKIGASLKLAGALTQIAFGGSPSVEEEIFLKAYPESSVCRVFSKNYCDEK